MCSASEKFKQGTTILTTHRLIFCLGAVGVEVPLLYVVNVSKFVSLFDKTMIVRVAF